MTKTGIKGKVTGDESLRKRLKAKNLRKTPLRRYTSG